MNALDLLLAIAVVLAAAGFLIWNLTGRGAKPACHTPSPVKDDTSNVMIGGALQKGLDRAKRRSSGSGR